jgi:hypothetical protein
VNCFAEEKFCLLWWKAVDRGGRERKRKGERERGRGRGRGRKNCDHNLKLNTGNHLPE